MWCRIEIECKIIPMRNIAKTQLNHLWSLIFRGILWVIYLSEMRCRHPQPSCYRNPRNRYRSCQPFPERHFVFTCHVIFSHFFDRNASAKKHQHLHSIWLNCMSISRSVRQSIQMSSYMSLFKLFNSLQFTRTMSWHGLIFVNHAFATESQRFSGAKISSLASYEVAMLPWKKP